MANHGPLPKKYDNVWPMPSHVSVCVSDVAFAADLLIKLFFYTKHNRDNGCNVLDRDDHGGRRAGRRQSKPSGGTEGAQFWSGGTARYGNYPYERPEGRPRGWGSWGKGQPPSPSARGSGECSKLPPAWFGQSPSRQRVFLPPSDFLSPTLFILASCNCVLSCLCLYDCNTFS